MIDLQPFCGKDDPRAYLNAPFSEGEFTYATNGHILIRVAKRADIIALPEQMKGRCAKMFWDNPWRELLPIPDVPPAEILTCVYCDGAGKLDFGDKDLERCDECEGIGKWEPWKPGFPLGKAHFAQRYLRLLKALPDCKISANHASKPAPFTFDGGCGLLMPMRYP